MTVEIRMMGDRFVVEYVLGFFLSMLFNSDEDTPFIFEY